MREMKNRFLVHGLLATAFLLSTVCAFGDDAPAKKDLGEFEPKPPMKSVDPAKFSKAPTVPSRPEPAWERGIVETGLAPFQSRVFKFENQWHEILNGEHVKVYAGADGRDTSQGLVVVQVTGLDSLEAGPPEVFKTSERVGPLRIVSAKETQLTLSSGEGVRFLFDVEKRKLSRRTSGR